MEVFSLLKDKKTMGAVKELIAKGKLFFKILPVCEVTEVNMGEQKYVAVLFEHSPANIKRVTAISDLFEDILPPFEAIEDFTLTDATEKPQLYAALLFEVPAQESRQ